MQFQIGAVTYSVRRRWSLTLDGETVAGYAAAFDHCIMLDGDLCGESLLQTLRHEYSHAWAFEVGEPADAESIASFTATVGAAFARDFQAGGGMAALEAIPIEGVRPTRDRRVIINCFTASDRVACGRCNCIVMDGSIFTGAARFNPDLGFKLAVRGFACPSCESVQVWQERTSDDGIPTGQYFAVRLLVGREADEWRAEHTDLVCDYYSQV